ncbi:hypothetical protein WICMUC_002288 [Wickerhamomyces mucosus]|uniref:Phospholipid scramblase n=1 Tax=Wickerhamomyces mucosus TaxID=1378264 RepID=A0A9P8PPP6_9ASCO|nr:hypothetical protein WICMUC_002288 [Wickerhamomyces mucosus]
MFGKKNLSSIARLIFKRNYSPLPRNGFKNPPKLVKPDIVKGSSSVYTNQYSNSYIPNPNGFIRDTDGIARILSEPTIVIERQLEMMSVFLGVEQANRYVLMDAVGNRIGRMEERDLSLFKMITRQVYRLHRPFLVDVFDNNDNLVLTIKRPFSFINSHIKAILPTLQNDDEGIIGESIQSWHLWRRRYNLFKASSSEQFQQFGAIDSGLLSFEFPVWDENGKVIASVDRNWVGLGRELFTDTGIYIVRLDPIAFSGLQDQYPNISNQSLTLDQRAVLLGNAVSIDFDYFSRHSNNNGGLISFGGSE